jgi:glucose-1-phosphatase
MGLMRSGPIATVPSGAANCIVNRVIDGEVQFISAVFPPRSSPPRMPITTLVFDFGNVLGFFDHGRAVEQLARHAAISAAAIRERLFTEDLEEAYESGRIGTAELLAYARSLCGFRCADAEIESAFADMFWPNEDVCRLVPALKSRYRLFLLSNTNDMHCRWFCRQFAETLNYFDGLVFSHEVGMRKPDPGIYEHCERLMACRPSECVFVDDLPRNIAAARECGWHGIVYTNADELCRGLATLGVVVSSPSRESSPRALARD